MPGRTDRASRLIEASPAAIYRAFVNPDALAAWLPPAGMTGRFEHFDARPGGHYRMVLVYDEPGSGKSSDDSDIVEAEFVRLVPDREVVQRATFESDDPAFSGVMTMTWSLEPEAGGTRVYMAAEDAPVGISAEDHAVGMNSSLENLASYVEDEAG